MHKPFKLSLMYFDDNTPNILIFGELGFKFLGECYLMFKGAFKWLLTEIAHFLPVWATLVYVTITHTQHLMKICVLIFDCIHFYRCERHLIMGFIYIFDVSCCTRLIFTHFHFFLWNNHSLVMKRDFHVIVGV